MSLRPADEFVMPAETTRGARYFGTAKIKVQHLATAAAINLKRYAAEIEDTFTLRPRSPFAALAPAMVKT